jgi:hypothetical protein
MFAAFERSNALQMGLFSLVSQVELSGEHGTYKLNQAGVAITASIANICTGCDMYKIMKLTLASAMMFAEVEYVGAVT